jgi:hypothetical protein
MMPDSIPPDTGNQMMPEPIEGLPRARDEWTPPRHVGGSRRVRPDEEVRLLVGRIGTAFGGGRYGLTDDEVRDKAEWVVAGWPWWEQVDV